MQIFVARNGTREGPYSREEVMGKFAAGTLGGADLAWFEGIPDWIPLAQVPGIVPPISPVVAVTPSAGPIPEPVPTSGPQRRPWVRYAARMLDLYLSVLAIGLIVGLFAPNLLVGMNRTLLGIVFVGLWCLFEPIFMVTCFTTPGKALLRITVRHGDGSALSFAEAMARSFRVWMQGMGFGLPLVSFFTLIASYERVAKQGATAWDEADGYRVSHQVIGPWRAAAAVLVGAGLLGLTVYGMLPK
ncbi:MAG: RDD family protein [Opitutae bacterium]|nr:RDD family protein [Opitutae bacterium]